MFILDNHIHLSPLGRGWMAVRDFEKAGGTHIVLNNMPYQGMSPLSTGSFEKQFDTTLKLAEQVRENTGVGVFVSLGPYPVELIAMAENMGLEKAEKAMKEGMDLAAKHVGEGMAHAIGEVGRPHFPVEPDILEASNRILIYGMEKASEACCPVVVHCETATPDTWNSLASMADEAGLPREKVVKHFSSAVVNPSINMGITPSIIASKDAIKSALRQGTGFLLETDFLDDPTRPGAVLDIRTIPKRVKWMIEEGVENSVLEAIFQKNPERLYGVDMSQGEP